MGTASVTTIAGEIQAAPLNSNFANLVSSANNIVAGQITDGTITNAEIAAGADIRLSKLSTGASDALLSNVMENHIDGCVVTVLTDDLSIGVSSGSVMINGLLRRNTSDVDTDPAADPTAADWLDVWALADDAGSSEFTISLVDSGVAPGGSVNPAVTNGRLIGSVYHKGSGVYSKTINFRNDSIFGWDYIAGNDSVNASITVTFGKTANDFPVISTALLGSAAAIPTNIDKLVSAMGYSGMVQAVGASGSACTVHAYAEVGKLLAAGTYYGIAWEAKGKWA